jgi:quinol monooxygenase YgiN
MCVVYQQVYVSVEAFEFHKAQPHYQAWANFKAEGGVVSQDVVKSKGTFYTF